ncbi:hypothetical protein GCM10027416_09720 [Okibacterium endophyticum]
MSTPIDAMVRLATADSGRPLLRALVAQLARVDADDVLIEASCPDCDRPHGRPYVVAPPAAVHISVSLSHVGETVIAAACAGGAVGVDAEATNALADPRRAAETREAIGHRGSDVLRAWTRVEAVLKADGRGLRVDPRAVSLADEDGLVIARVPGDPRRYQVFEVDAGPEIVVSLAREL